VHLYGLDFGTTTTYLTDGSTGQVIAIPLGGNEGQIGPDDGDALYSRVKEVAGELVAGAIDGKRSLKSMLQAGPTQGLTSAEVDKYVEAIFSRVIQIAKERSNIDLTKDKTVKLCCPAAWGKEPRERLFKLAQKSGLGLVEHVFVEEPVAAGLAWIHKNIEAALKPGLTLVYDMGGGTLDVAILDVQAGSEVPQVYVLGSGGNFSAGDSVDELLLQRAIANSGGAEVQYNTAIASIEEYKKELATKSNLDVVEVLLNADSKTKAQITQGDLEFALRGVISSGQKLIDRVLRDAYRLDLLKHSGIGPDSQLPGSDGRLEETFFEPKFPGWLIDESKRVDITELHRSVRNVILAGGMSNTIGIQRALQAVFTKADFYLGEAPLGKQGPHSASKVISLGLGNPARFGSLNLAQPNFDILVGGVCQYEAHVPVLENEQVELSSPVLRKVVFGGKSGQVEIKFIGSKAIPMKDIGGSPVVLSSVDRTILYPDATFVAFETTGRRVEVEAEGYAGAGFAKRYSYKDIRPETGGFPTRQRDTHDVRKEGRSLSLAPNCSAGRIEVHLGFRKRLQTIWPGVSYLDRYVKVLTEITQPKTAKSAAIFLETLDHESENHKSCQPNWFAFLLANISILGWKAPSVPDSAQLQQFAKGSDFKVWSASWFDSTAL
jgi:hypothetical protein